LNVGASGLWFVKGGGGEVVMDVAMPMQQSWQEANDIL
jgi:hypothetical protein